MKLTVLGKYGPYPSPGGACSGYLVEEGSTKILVDCGNGVLSRLLQLIRVPDLSAIVLSHLHSDHMSDMMVLRYALNIWAMKGMMEEKPLKVYAPPEPEEEYTRLSTQNVFDVEPILEGMQVSIGAINLSFCEMTHPVQSFGVKFVAGNKRLVYTGDTNMNDHIVSFAKNADFFFADTGLLDQDKTGPNVPHLTALEVGRIASEAAVQRLMITHIWEGYDEEHIRKEVAIHYPDAFVAQEMQSYEI